MDDVEKVKQKIAETKDLVSDKQSLYEYNNELKLKNYIEIKKLK